MDFETKKLSISDETDESGKPIELLLNLWDFGGEKKFRLLFPSYVSGSSGALLLYDLTNKDSLEDLHNWIQIIDNVPNPPRTKILIEAKKDLEEKREITKEDAMKIFNQYKFQGDILSTSAKTGENVEEAFEMLGRAILRNSLKKCHNCGKHFPLELAFCQYCGVKRE